MSKTLSNAYNGTMLRRAPSVFRSLDLARSWGTGLWVIMGRPGEFLAVCPADFNRLVRAGYEPAPL